MSEFISRRGISLNALVNAKEVGRVLKRLGAFTPEVIISEASNKASPLHKYFEWDDSKAAHAYRLTQARHLVISIGIEQEGQFIRSFESVVLDDGRVYLPMDQIRQSPDLVDQVLQSSMRELLFWKAKHQGYKTFFGGVFDAIDEAEEKLSKHGKAKESKVRRAKGSKVRNPANKKARRNNNNHRGLTAAR